MPTSLRIFFFETDAELRRFERKDRAPAGGAPIAHPTDGIAFHRMEWAEVAKRAKASLLIDSGR